MNKLKYRVFTAANFEDLEEVVQDYIDELYNEDVTLEFLGAPVFVDDPDDGPYVYQVILVKEERYNV